MDERDREIRDDIESLLVLFRVRVNRRDKGEKWTGVNSQPTAYFPTSEDVTQLEKLLFLIDRLNEQLAEVKEVEPLLVVMKEVKEYEDIDDVEITYTDKSGERCIAVIIPENFRRLAKALDQIEEVKGGN